METIDIVKWLEENIRFIKICHEHITRVKVYNKTVVNFGKKYHRIYIDIDEDLPEKVLKPISEMTNFDIEVNFYCTINRYITFTARYEPEDTVKFHYEWISASIKVRLPMPPFILEIEDYIIDTNKYFESY